MAYVSTGPTAPPASMLGRPVASPEPLDRRNRRAGSSSIPRPLPASAPGAFAVQPLRPRLRTRSVAVRAPPASALRDGACTPQPLASRAPHHKASFSSFSSQRTFGSERSRSGSSACSTGASTRPPSDPDDTSSLSVCDDGDTLFGLRPTPDGGPGRTSITSRPPAKARASSQQVSPPATARPHSGASTPRQDVPSRLRQPAASPAHPPAKPASAPGHRARAISLLGVARDVAPASSLTPARKMRPRTAAGPSPAHAAAQPKRSVSSPAHGAAHKRFGFPDNPNSPAKERGLRPTDVAAARSPPLLDIGALDAQRLSRAALAVDPPPQQLQSRPADAAPRPPRGEQPAGPAGTPRPGGPSRSSTATTITTSPVVDQTAQTSHPPRAETRAELVQLLAELVGGEDVLRGWGVDAADLAARPDPGFPAAPSRGEAGGSTRASQAAARASRESALWLATGLSPEPQTTSREGSDQGAEADHIDEFGGQASPARHDRLAPPSSARSKASVLQHSHTHSSSSSVLGGNKLQRKTPPSTFAPAARAAPPHAPQSSSGSGGGFFGRLGWRGKSGGGSSGSGSKRPVPKPAAAPVRGEPQKDDGSARQPYPGPPCANPPKQDRAQASEAKRSTVLGVPLSEMNQQASCMTIIGGQRHILPIVVFSSVEEIYKRGMSTPGLLRIAGDLGRIDTLADIFSSPPTFGDRHDVSSEDVHSLCGLLKRYLRALPGPLLDPRLGTVFWHTCVQPASLAEDRDGARRLSRSLGETTATAITSNQSKKRVAIVQCILRLLPVRAFSLLVYVTAFLSQMPLYPENRLTLASLATILGPALLAPRDVGLPGLGPATHGAAAGVLGGEGADARRAAEGMKSTEGLLWLLNHWNHVTDGLLEECFSVDVECFSAPTLVPHLISQQPGDRAVPIGQDAVITGSEALFPENANSRAANESELSMSNPRSIVASWSEDGSSSCKEESNAPFQGCLIGEPPSTDNAAAYSATFSSDTSTALGIAPTHHGLGKMGNIGENAPKEARAGAAAGESPRALLAGLGYPGAVEPGQFSEDGCGRHRSISSGHDAREIVDRYDATSSPPRSRASTRTEALAPACQYKHSSRPGPIASTSASHVAPTTQDVLPSPTEIMDVLSDLIRRRDQAVRGQAWRMSQLDAQAEQVKMDEHPAGAPPEILQLRAEVGELLGRLAAKERESARLKEAAEAARFAAGRAGELEREAAGLRGMLADQVRASTEAQGRLRAQLERAERERDEYERQLLAVKRAVGVAVVGGREW